MLNWMVPPPMLLASRIAWRNEPVPVSSVFVTVKTEGDVTLFAGVGGAWWSMAFGFLASLTREEGVNRVVRDALAKVETSKREEANNKATTASIILNAAARTESFCFLFIFVAPAKCGV